MANRSRKNLQKFYLSDEELETILENVNYPSPKGNWLVTAQ